MVFLLAFAWLAALLAAAAAFFAGRFWLEAARHQSSWSESTRMAAKFTGAAFIIGSLAFVAIVATKIPTGG
ncbi:hypothetical protein D9601_10250 [Sphingomonas sp. MA1305]|uniref:hypothetical protein n=1 Tax=Sphingomonas sp. MA1305 TaxID=2479204 RepID=UPI0018E04E79|nr:hypothetical protein [Sphingomonas sp. MA1305]MBI0475732.1 hypothetical protein [Sphingomonas sp. MA1305]